MARSMSFRMSLKSPLRRIFSLRAVKLPDLLPRPMMRPQPTGTISSTPLSAVDRSERPGTRSHSASAYLLPNIGRANLKILTGANVGKVHSDRSGPTSSADGVGFWYNGTRYTASVKREVVISAGTYKTPLSSSPALEIRKSSRLQMWSVLCRAHLGGRICKTTTPLRSHSSLYQEVFQWTLLLIRRWFSNSCNCIRKPVLVHW